MSKFIRIQEVLEITKLSRTTLWRLEKLGKFPKRHKIGVRAVAWLQQDIDHWIENFTSNDNDGTNA